MRYFRSQRLLYPLLAILVMMVAGCEDDPEIIGRKIQNIQVNGFRFGVYANTELKEADGGNSRFSNLLIFMHGAELNGGRHFDYAFNAVSQLGLQSETIVLAPQIETEPVRNTYQFSDLGWKDGNLSLSGLPRLSSYALLDSVLLNTVLPNYPEIDHIIIAGHSAGGQFVFRYALLSTLPDLISQPVVYLPMNPSSYAYIGPERWDSGSRTFVVPDVDCSGYNSWNYGLEDIGLNQYKKNITEDSITSFFADRNLVYTVGTRDVDSADKGCEANLMGNGRYERGLLAYDYILFKDPGTSHSLVEVEGVAHDANAMINSPEVLSIIDEVFN